MHKVRIVMDDEKIIQYGKKPETAQAVIDDVLVRQLKLRKEGDEYIGSWSSVWAGIAYFRKKEWFRVFVKEWEYFTNDYTGNPDDFVCEDLTDGYIDGYEKVGAM